MLLLDTDFQLMCGLYMMFVQIFPKQLSVDYLESVEHVVSNSSLVCHLKKNYSIFIAK